MTFSFSRFALLFYFIFLQFSSLTGVHVDHSKNSNQSHLCVEVCQPNDTCDDSKDSGPHDEESLLEHVLDGAGLCSKLFVSKLDKLRCLDLDFLQFPFRFFYSFRNLVSYELPRKQGFLLVRLLQSRAPPVTF